MNYTRKLIWYSHVLNTLKDRLQGKVIGTTMNLSTSRASAVRQTPPVEQARDSKNKHAIKRSLDGIIPSKTNLKAQSIGLMPRLGLLLDWCQDLAFDHCHMKNSVRLVTSDMCCLQTSKAPAPEISSPKDSNLIRESVQRTAGIYIIVLYIIWSLITSHCLIEMIFFVCYLPHVCCLCAARVLPCSVAPPCGAWHLPSRAGRAQ